MMHHARRFMTVFLTLTLLLVIPGLAAAQDGPVTHTVQAGETLYSIAMHYNVSVYDLAMANGISNPSLIYAGQVLEVPGQVALEPTFTPDTPDASETPDTPEATTVTPPAATPSPVPVGEDLIYVVQPGDNLFRIALKYNMTTTELAAYNGIANPRVIVVGQSIRIPAAAVSGQMAGATATVAPTEAPAGASEPAETMFPTAGPPEETETPVEVEETVYPTAGPAEETEAPAEATETPAAVEETVYPTAGPPEETAETPAPAEAVDTTPTLPPNEAANVGFAYGVEVHLPGQNMSQVVDLAYEMGTPWVKQQIEWANYETSKGEINWTPIDDMVDVLEESGLNVLFTVTSAPGWARDSEQERGPAVNNQDYADFIGAMAARYQGKVHAYEIWSEQNLRREWNTPRGISAVDYVGLLEAAFVAIKTADPAAVVVSGGLSPTGFNDGVNAIDDRVYLRQMYEAGVADWADAIGAHPSGWGNPPDSTCCRNNRPAVAAWDDHPSFFFKETLQDYREIMVANGDSGTYIWVTEFGWATTDGLNVDPPQELAFVAYTNLDEQAQYILRAYQLGRELGYVGPMFLWNLNLCQVVGVTGEQCWWGVLDPAGNPRPAYLALRSLLDN